MAFSLFVQFINTIKSALKYTDYLFEKFGTKTIYITKLAFIKLNLIFANLVY